MVNVSECNAKDPYTCRYHGALLRMEKARRFDDFDGYAAAKEDLEREKRKRGVLEFFGIKPEKAPADVTPAAAKLNPRRFRGEIEVRPLDGALGFYKKVSVYGSSREEVYDGLVRTAKSIVDEAKASFAPGTEDEELERKLYVTIESPNLEGKKDDENSMTAGPDSLRGLVRLAALNRKLAISFHNTHVISGRKARGTYSTADAQYVANYEVPYDASDEDLVSDKYSMVGKLVPKR